MKRVMLISLCLFYSLAYSQKAAKQTWLTSKLFQHDVFIENKGQFSEQEQKAVGDKILFSAHKGDLLLYFSKSSVTFRYDSAYLAGQGEEAEPENLRVKHFFMKMTWEGANKNAQVEAKNPV